MQYSFTSKIDVWGEGAGWHYVRMPKKTYEEIKEVSIAAGPRRGFGAVKVEVTIGKTTWQTSAFPDSEDKSYILFVKKAVRNAENINIDDNVSVNLELLV